MDDVVNIVVVAFTSHGINLFILNWVAKKALKQISPTEDRNFPDCYRTDFQSERMWMMLDVFSALWCPDCFL